MEHYSVQPITEREHLILEALRSMAPSIREIFANCATESDETKATTAHERGRAETPDSWRLRVHDMDMFCSAASRETLGEACIIPLSWRQLRDAVLDSE